MLVEVQSYGRIHDVYPQSSLKPVVNASEGVFDLSSGHMVHHKPSGCVLRPTARPYGITAQVRGCPFHVDVTEKICEGGGGHGTRSVWCPDHAPPPDDRNPATLHAPLHSQKAPIKQRLARPSQLVGRCPSNDNRTIPTLLSTCHFYHWPVVVFA